MTSRIRLDPAGGWHHVTCHRVEDGNLFEDDHDRWLFLRLLKDAAEKFGVEIASFSLMGNHIHLLLHCPCQGLSAFMHHVNGVYARTYNQRHARRGPLFTDNFFSDLITTDGQLIFTIRYIDRNALELGFDIRSYPWSSYRAYLRPDELVTIVPLAAKVPLGLVGGASAYRTFVETDTAADKTRFAQGTRILTPSMPVSPPDELGDLVAVASAAAANLPGTASARRRRARRAAVLIAHELAMGYGDEIRSFFGFNSMSAYTSFLYRAQLAAAADTPFFDEVRARWQLHQSPLQHTA